MVQSSALGGPAPSPASTVFGRISTREAPSSSPDLSCVSPVPPAGPPGDQPTAGFSPLSPHCAAARSSHMGPHHHAQVQAGSPPGPASVAPPASEVPHPPPGPPLGGEAGRFTVSARGAQPPGGRGQTRRQGAP
uniref:Uncharacterized protein n=1 Tax=Pipistrellus kuhlii TaxID=59472 RepID=A0A7J7YWL7_PIPKU|nr:hypothetical protein mPipKuh1_009820 [Pipistrellus kuhlii]